MKGISIHTPTKGVTRFSSQAWLGSQISIHTPTKGVTNLQRCIFLQFKISIHTPTKGVTRSSSQAWQDLQISIHTPTKGVTFLGRQLRTMNTYFNPHSHEGSDLKSCHLYFCCLLFQSTLPRREWLVCLFQIFCIGYISIHTPTKGVTHSSQYNLSVLP